MANICITNLPAGIDSGCFGFESPVKNIVITKVDQSFASVTAATSLSAWKALLAALNGYVPNGLASYEPTAAEPKINTTAFGKQFVSLEGIPSAKVMLETSSGDFAELLKTLRGGLFRVYFLLDNGNVKGTVDSSGLFKGFKVRINAHTPGVQALDKQEDFYPLNLLFDDYEEFVEAVVVNTTWNSSRELVSAMPFGLSIVKTAAYNVTTGIQSVYIASRGGTPYSGLALGDFAVIDSNVITPAITAVTDNSNGLYDIVLNKESTPIALASGDFFKFRVEKGTPITAVSSVTTVNV